MEGLQAVLFDLDGTIVDSRVPYSRSVNYALTGIGLPAVPDQELYQYLGPPMHETLIAHLGVPPELVDRCITLYRERYSKLGMAETEVFAGIPELLRDLHGRVPLAVATSKVRTLAQPLLETLGLAALFDAVSAPGPDAVNESKSATVAAALDALGHPERAMMIGDRFYDVEGAADQGLPTIGVLWGVGTADELLSAGAVAVVSTPAEIPGALGL